jgi:mannose-6-phosphate isomerase-like protein (cupin superfamily)
MSNGPYEPQRYAGLSRQEILSRVRDAGWDVYPPHQHTAAKLLAILSGSMAVTIDGQTYQCAPGDQVVIPGGVVHAAVVGPEGCTFYWSEQIR